MLWPVFVCDHSPTTLWPLCEYFVTTLWSKAGDFIDHRSRTPCDQSKKEIMVSDRVPTSITGQWFVADQSLTWMKGIYDWVLSRASCHLKGLHSSMAVVSCLEATMQLVSDRSLSSHRALTAQQVIAAQLRQCYGHRVVGNLSPMTT